MKKIRISSIVSMCFVLFSASFGFTEELRILCWEGYAIPEYTEPFETLIQEK